MRRTDGQVARWIVAVSGLALAGLASAPSAAAGQTADEADVRAVIEAFKAALAGEDGDAAIALLHPDVRVFESGHAETHEEYRSGHLAADMTFLSGVTSEIIWDEVELGVDLALYASRYRATGEYRGSAVDVTGTETMVLKRTADGWRILHIHWSSR